MYKSHYSHFPRTKISTEHFQVWMRVAGLNKFKKLWGRIEEKLQAGKYKIEIKNSKTNLRFVTLLLINTVFP